MGNNNPSTGRSILVVDDDEAIRRALREYLELEGYAIREAASIEEARVSLELVSVDLVTLDLGLGSSNGLDLAREIKATSDIPIIMITAKADEIDKVVGLELGADDYVVKPFALREVLARVRTVLRRSKRHPSATAPAAGTHTTFSSFKLDEGAKVIRHESGERVDLTAAELVLLQAFLERPGRLLSRNDLLDLTNPNDNTAFDRSIDTLVSRLRKKLALHEDSPELIKTVRGLGYIFSAVVTRA